MKITKLQVAQNQLITAIDLYFSDSDPISIHTLICASLRIFRDIATNMGDEDPLLKIIRPEKKKEWIKLMNTPQNFFKHADNDSDPNCSIEFNEDINGYFILDVCNLYQLQTKKSLPEIDLFLLWFFSKNPKLISDPIIRNNYNNPPAGLNIDNKIEFKKDIFPIVLLSKNKGIFLRS